MSKGTQIGAHCLFLSLHLFFLIVDLCRSQSHAEQETRTVPLNHRSNGRERLPRPFMSVDVYQSQKGGWRHLKFRPMQGILIRSMRNMYERRWQGADLVYLSTSTREWLYAINLISATPNHITMTLADVKMHS
ncbi:hypothetical protein EDB83DRAFT_2391336 [Lactarius deliciosus]|nr:hypothetical protein EDB83DRAFT_2391336 [Lactarius deliciosus]